MLKTLTLSMLMLFAATVVHNANASSSNQIHVYEYIPVPVDLVIQVKNPLEAYPNQTINVNITIEALVSLAINYTAIELYTFNNSTMRDEEFDCILHVDEENPVPLSGGKSLNETSYNVTIPEYASNIIYGKLILQWTEKGTEESAVYGKGPTFIMVYLRNPELERLRSKVAELEAENAELKENATKLNKTLTDVLNNLTDLENRYEGGLGDTRSVITILAITTIFFVATTVYLFMRKPKQYW